MGQVGAEVALELLGALDADLDGLGGGDRFAVSRPELHELAVDLGANGLLGGGRSLLPHDLGAGLARHAHDDGRRGSADEGESALRVGDVSHAPLDDGRLDAEKLGDAGSHGALLQ